MTDSFCRRDLGFLPVARSPWAEGSLLTFFPRPNAHATLVSLVRLCIMFPGGASRLLSLVIYDLTAESEGGDFRAASNAPRRAL